MTQSKEFTDASHALNTLSHALALLESKNASLQGAVEGTSDENAKLRELVRMLVCATHPADRATLIANAADLIAEVDE